MNNIPFYECGNNNINYIIFVRLTCVYPVSISSRPFPFLIENFEVFLIGVQSVFSRSLPWILDSIPLDNEGNGMMASNNENLTLMYPN